MKYEVETLLVDSDLLLYLSHDPEEPAEYILRSVRLMLEDMQKKTKCKNMRVFLSSSTNFRYKVDPDYKIGRRDTPKPPHYLTTKNYLIKYYNAEVSPDGLEADDYIAQLQNDNISTPITLDKGNISIAGNNINFREKGDTCISSLDKDFLTVTGLHYKWRHHNAGNVFNVTEDDAEAFLCYQLLIGDKADSIISPLKKYKKDGTLGKTGWGHVAARDFLVQYDYDEMREAVLDEYIKQGYGDDYCKNYKLLAIGRLTNEETKAERDS